MRTFTSRQDLIDAVGEELGTSDWFSVDQARVDAFAACTMDNQWIHVDVERSAAGPFGGTIAHGFLSLSLLPHLGAQIFAIDLPGPTVNYGLDKVRFPTPLLVGRRVRAHAQLVRVTETQSGTQLLLRYVVEADGEVKPVCVADVLALLAGQGPQ